MARLKMERGQDNPILRTPSAVIKKIDKKLLKFIEDMKETMELEHGVGLAAPQVGVNLRVVVCKFNYDTPHELVVGMINPVIMNKSAIMDLNEEGCLSLPKRFDAIARHSAVTVKFLDVKGRQQILKLKNFNARVVQHEVDHVDAHLYIDHINDPETIRLKMEEK
ncbi:MAG: peptide deformylase [Candidatus Gracilibacteria bacterium]|jgi:peptide deformylase